MMRWRRILLVAAAWILAVPADLLAQPQAPDALVRRTVEEVLTIVRADKEIQAGNVETIARLMDQKVAPHFDFTRMTRLAVGRSWREATPVQRDAIAKEFRTLLVRTYSAAFTSYKDLTVEYRPLKMSPEEQEATVSTVIHLPGGNQPIAVDYDMEQTPAGWKVYDVRIDGASLIINYRNMFAEEIQRGGIEGLLKSLIEKNSGALNTNRKG